MISAVLADALVVYRRLIRRSIVVAGLVFAVISLANALAARATSLGATIVSAVLSIIGGLLVQGALVEVVRDLHEGRPVARVAEYYDRTRGRLGTLLGAALLLGTALAGTALAGVLLFPLGVIFIVAAMILTARWSLIVPLVMIEGRSVGEAFRRSAELVKGRTGRIIVIVVLTDFVILLGAGAIAAAFGFLPTFLSIWLGGTVAGAIAIPYEAHVLTVLYYRLTEPDRPVLPERPARPAWREGPPA